MAFNPFHGFRKHSKVVFAGLAILCMVTFVLSSGMGRGDFFQQAGEWFGHRSGGAVATVYGKDYGGQDLDAIRRQRFVAAEYMDAATALARNNLMVRANEAMS